MRKIKIKALLVYSYSSYRLIIKRILFRHCMFCGFYNSFYNEFVRPLIWRLLGAKVGKDVAIGHLVYADLGGMRRILISDNVEIADRCVFLCHRRNVGSYFYANMLPYECPFLEGFICLEKGAQIGIGAIIMPDVTVGEGAIVAAGAVVSKNVEPWTIVGGNPAKVIRCLSPQN